ncbi:ABC transporter substrate-binding protein [Agrobacterium sp. SORGH_AS 787]|uniref:ABC transporter substrate-binding protein n=1 Tax=Agrobacterium sp. SORGH_AS 787 TaxID=3041775 RepID=UPI0027827BD8|nr:peptide/nickel transport system substrate-binding protein [Rhizobium sp. SORGH_AS_0787]
MIKNRTLVLAMLAGSVLIGDSGFASRSFAEDAGGSENIRVRLAMLQPPRSGLTPLSDDAFKLSRWSMAETLINLDAGGLPTPSLATEWSQLDGHTWRFIIRRGVKFHDGTELTPERVVASLTAATKASPKPRILDGVSLEIMTDGDDAVMIRSRDVDPLIPNRLSSPQLAILAKRAYGENGRVNPIEAGTGPFVLKEINGTTSAKLDRFDSYWGEKARVAGIDADYVPDGTARAAALRTGTAHIVEAIPVSQAALLDQKLIHEVPMPRTNTLYLNTKTGVFADPDKRRIAAAAINRDMIVRMVYEGRADIARGLLGPALPWAAGLRKQANAPQRGNAAGAEIVLATFTDRAELPEVAVLLQQQLTDAGFTVKMEVRQYAHIEADALAGRFDAFVLSRATVLDSGDPVAYMFSDFSCAGSFNLSQLCDQGVDAALRRAQEASAGEQRHRAIIEAEAAILATNAAIPMLHERVIQGEVARVANAVRDPRERQLVSTKTSLGAE